MPSRFAPSTTGPAHPGTLLSAMLTWLDARTVEPRARFILRLEDIDPQRCKPEHAEDMIAALSWLGIDWDELQYQSQHRAAHENALDKLAEAGLLYPCTCSRAEIRRAGVRAADDGWRYPGTCRQRATSGRDWRTCTARNEAVRLRLNPDLYINCHDESGLSLSQNPFEAMGDPVLVSRTSALAYHLAVVVDDATRGINRIVRGRDLAASTGIHRVLQNFFEYPTPQYRHHFLLLEPDNDGKLSKLHGAVGWPELSANLSSGQVCCFLAGLAGILGEESEARERGWSERASACAEFTPDQLLEMRAFHWSRVPQEDAAVTWTGNDLHAGWKTE